MIMQSDYSDERWIVISEWGVLMSWIECKLSNDDEWMLRMLMTMREDKPKEESCSSRRWEKEKALGRLVDFDFDLHLRFNSIHDPLLDALLLLGYGTHHRICPEVVIRPRSS
jgi:hypothetical protein